VFLLNTMVLSELRKKQRDANLVAWLGAVPESSLFLSVVTISEVEKGIAGVTGRDEAFARRLEAWRDTVLRGFADRILGIDISIAGAGDGSPPRMVTPIF
jgi:predicted nucleic acid-binding protein